MGEDKEQKLCVDAGNAKGCNDCPGGWRHHPCQHWNSNNNNNTSKFCGETKETEQDTFDNTGPHDATLFTKSLKNIVDYLKLTHANDVSEAMQNMTPIPINIPLCHG